MLAMSLMGFLETFNSNGLSLIYNSMFPAILVFPWGWWSNFNTPCLWQKYDPSIVTVFLHCKHSAQSNPSSLLLQMLKVIWQE